CLKLHFVEPEWGGEKNNGFDILYHNMKHGQISTKEVADFIRERMTVEEVYAKSLTKLAKTASNNSQLGTFAPMWEVFRASSERLASCHQELSRKLMELIREVQKYGDEQTKQHKKTKEEVSGTLEAVQGMQSTTQALLKAKEVYNSKHQETERLKKEGNHKEYEKAQVKSRKAMEAYKVFVDKYANVRSDFEHKMTETAQRFQEIEEAHLQSLHDFIKAFSQAVEDTHTLIGQVHMEFRQQVRDITADNLIEKYSESKGTGKERP
uniref:F-BAR domain-containing protein n=1 Tax=Petromyzon marinus TaxID=7757 RepID=S4RQE4_PETMA